MEGVSFDDRGSSHRRLRWRGLTKQASVNPFSREISWKDAEQLMLVLIYSRAGPKARRRRGGPAGSAPPMDGSTSSY